MIVLCVHFEQQKVHLIEFSVMQPWTWASTGKRDDNLEWWTRYIWIAIEYNDDSILFCIAADLRKDFVIPNHIIHFASTAFLKRKSPVRFT